MIKETIPFNFDDLYASVEAKFVENGYDTQPGSNTMQLVTAMTYLVSMLNTNTAVNINENLLTLARKRNNVLQDARLLGYEPGNKVSFQYQIELTLPAGDFILHKYTEFISSGKTYYYFGDIISLTGVPEGQKINILVKEGTLIKANSTNGLTVNIEEFVENGITKNQYYVDVPYIDIEDSGVETFLTYYDDNGILFNKEQWTEIETFTVDSDTILDKQFYRLNIIEYGTPRIYFKLPNTGNDLRLGTKIELNVLQSSGSSGEMLELPTTTLLCEVTSFSLKIQGTEEETISSIKQNAPLFWNSANRAVTKNDYKSICERLTIVDKAYIWDGNDEYPKIPGKIWFSFVPSTFIREYLKNAYKTIFELNNYNSEENWFLEDAEIFDVFSYLEAYTIPTLNFLHRHPIFLDFEFDINILKYDISTSESEQNQVIFNIIDEYFSKKDAYYLENFGTEFFRSNIIKRIDTQITDITGMNISIKNNIVLYNKYIINENNINKIIIPIGLPYEDIYTLTGDLIVSNMPDINTIGFIDSKDLVLDYSSLTGNEIELNMLELNIKLGTDIIGKYTLFANKYILVEIIIDGTIITSGNINQKVLSLKYKNDNIKMTKNMIPRLKSVNFI